MPMSVWERGIPIYQWMYGAGGYSCVNGYEGWVAIRLVGNSQNYLSSLVGDMSECLSLK